MFNKFDFVFDALFVSDAQSECLVQTGKCQQQILSVFLLLFTLLVILVHGLQRQRDEAEQ